MCLDLYFSREAVVASDYTEGVLAFVWEGEGGGARSDDGGENHHVALREKKLEGTAITRIGKKQCVAVDVNLWSAWWGTVNFVSRIYTIIDIGR